MIKIKYLSLVPPEAFKKREQSVMGVVYLKNGRENKMKYYLSVSFVPKLSEDKVKISIPVVLVHQIPLMFE